MSGLFIENCRRPFAFGYTPLNDFHQRAEWSGETEGNSITQQFAQQANGTDFESASLTLNNERASSEGNSWTAFATAVVISGNAQEGAVLGTGWRSLDIPFDGDSRINGSFIG